MGYTTGNGWELVLGLGGFVGAVDDFAFGEAEFLAGGVGELVYEGFWLGG